MKLMMRQHLLLLVTGYSLKEFSMNRNSKHGMCQSREYHSWQAMKQRCLNSNSKDFHRYGGRGISVCARWLDSFENFYADMGDRPANMSLDRINVNSDYTPENCRWATASQQLRNTRVNHLLTFNGKTQTIMDWSDETGLAHDTILRRMNAGWDASDALTVPVEEGNARARWSRDRSRKNNRWLEVDGVRKIVSDWGSEYGICPTTIVKRIDKFGWDVKDAVTAPSGASRGIRLRGKGSKLDEWSVGWIKKLAKAGNKQFYLADVFKVSRQVINDICRGKTWKHVEVA